VLGDGLVLVESLLFDRRQSDLLERRMAGVFSSALSVSDATGASISVPSGKRRTSTPCPTELAPMQKSSRNVP
jgi:hypothetical protein